LHLNQILEMLFSAEKDIRLSSNPRMAFEIVMLRLQQVTPLLPIGDLIDKLDDLKTNLGTPTGTSQPMGANAGKPAASRGGDPEQTDLYRADSREVEEPAKGDNLVPLPGMATDTEADREDTWQRLVDIISDKHPSLGPNLASSRMIGLSGDVLEIEVNGSSFNYKRIIRKDSMKILTEVCSACLGRQVTVSIREGDKKDHQDKKKKKTENERVKQTMLEHPLVAEAIEIFNGKVVDVKVDTK